MGTHGWEPILLGQKSQENPQATGSPDAIKKQLGRVLASRAFSRSDSLSSFLRFVVEKTLLGQGGRLKARTIAIEALGRSKSFSSKADPIVSIQASRLRRALDKYYEQEGRDDAVRIRLPKGSYQAQFEAVERLSSQDVRGTRQPAGVGPRIAMIPLVDLSPSEAGDYFSVGLSQELVAVLASFSELTIVDVPALEAGATVAEYASRLAEEAAVRFVFSGTLRRTENTIALRVQLTEAQTGEVVWTQKIKRDLSASQLLDLEEDIAHQVAKTVGENYGVIPRAMAAEAHRKRTDELSVYDAVLRFRHYQFVVTNESRDSAIAALERAVQIDPDCGLCWAMLSEAVCDAYGLRIDSRLEVLSRARELARKAISLDPECQHAYWALTLAYFHSRERDMLLQSAESAIKLNPNNGYLVGASAWAMALAGEWNRGLAILDRLIEQNPFYPTWIHLAPYLNHYRQGEFEAALHHANQFNIPDLAWDPILKAAALANLGRVEEAIVARQRFTSAFPNAAADPTHYLRGYIYRDDHVAEVVDGLRKAGWSERQATVSSTPQ